MVVAASHRFLSTSEGARSQRLPGRLRLELAVVPPGAGEQQRLLGWIVDDEAPVAAKTPAEELLTDRQRAVARAAAAGETVPRIARRLRLRAETVRTHLRDVYRRLGIRDRTELARLVAPIGG
jgi:DNA-binding NarL/FixJ family response regulator